MIAGVEQLSGKKNYLTDSDPQKWHTDIPTFAKVRYRNVYRGVDVVWYGNQRQLEYDLIVAPGTDLQAIQIAFEGAQKIRLDGEGNLLIHASGQIVQHRRPMVYQTENGIKKEFSGWYVLLGKHTVSFRIAKYNRLVVALESIS